MIDLSDDAVRTALGFTLECWQDDHDGCLAGRKCSCPCHWLPDDDGLP